MQLMQTSGCGHGHLHAAIVAGQQQFATSRPGHTTTNQFDRDPSTTRHAMTSAEPRPFSLRGPEAKVGGEHIRSL